MVTAILLFAVSSILGCAWLFFLIKGFFHLFSNNCTTKDVKRWIGLEIVLFAAAIFVFVLACFAGLLGFIALF